MKVWNRRGYVEILAAPEPHSDYVLVRRERLLQFLRLRRRVQRVLGLAEINSTEIEPRRRVIRIRFCNTPEDGFGIGVTQFALVQDSQGVINVSKPGVHLLGRGQFTEQCIKHVGLHQGEAQVQVVSRECMSGSHHLLELGDRLRIFALFVISLADVPRGLCRSRTAIGSFSGCRPL